MCMMKIPTEFQVSGNSDALGMTIKQKRIENYHKMTTLLFAFHKNCTLKKLHIF